MSRIAFLARHPRRSLTALATLVAAGAVVVGSGAVFSTQTANPSNTFASGILAQSNSNNGAVLTASNLIPGASDHNSKSGVVDITNSGTVAGVFSLDGAITADEDSANGTSGNGTARSSNKLSHALRLVVQDCGLWTSSNTVAPACPADTNTTTGMKYDGLLDGVSAEALGTYAAGDKHRYKFLVWLPNGTTDTSPGASSVGGTGDNALSGAFTSADFTWNAVTN
jgi:hypothetical protein